MEAGLLAGLFPDPVNRRALLKSVGAATLLPADGRLHRAQVNATISLAHLAPDIVEAAIAGRLPHGLAMRDLIDPPLAWQEQRRRIGIAS